MVGSETQRLTILLRPHDHELPLQLQGIQPRSLFLSQSQSEDILCPSAIRTFTRLRSGFVSMQDNHFSYSAPAYNCTNRACMSRNAYRCFTQSTVCLSSHVPTPHISVCSTPGMSETGRAGTPNIPLILSHSISSPCERSLSSSSVKLSHAKLFHGTDAGNFGSPPRMCDRMKNV